MTRPITSLEGFVRKITALTLANQGTRLLYRGHSKKSYTLSPSTYRSKNLQESEHLLLRQLFSEHPREFLEDSGTFDRLVRAQHYGLPTRLLDVTRNPLVALYFAVCSSPSNNGRVVVVKPSIDEQVYYDSSIVSVISNLSLLKHEEKKELIEKFIDVALLFCTDEEAANITAPGAQVATLLLDVMARHREEVITEFNKCPPIAKLCSLVRREIPDFSARIDPRDLYRVFSVVPKKNHTRILAQDGGFLISGLTRAFIAQSMVNIKTEHFDIDHKSKTKILKDLSIVGINDQTLFPEIERSAKNIRDRYS